MEIVLHSKKSLFQQKFQKMIVPFQQEFPIWKSNLKNDPIGPSESDKNIQLRLPVLLEIRLQLHPRTSGSDSTTLLPTRFDHSD